MAMANVPNEETPLLGGQQSSAAGGVTSPESEVATLAGSRTPSVKDRSNTDGGPDVIKKTPLPWAQLSIVLFLEIAEPLTAQVISPFAPELIRSLNVAKDEAEVGYYVGIIQSLFFATQACTVLHWSRLSDHIGRKPVILTGLFGLSLSMYCFAVSKTYWGFVLSRALNGALNGNIGVMRSAVVEMTDHTNLSRAYSYQPIFWSVGTTLGPIIGGGLSRPAERFPNVFGNNEFLEEHPYFLPCAVPATFTAVAWLVAFFFLKETRLSPKPILEFIRGEKKRSGSEEALLPTSEAPSRHVLEEPTSLRNLLTRDVIITSANYSLLAMVDISFRTLLPVFLSTPVAVGGLGLDPPAIGTIMSLSGILSGVFTVCLFSRATDYFGVKRVHLIGMIAAVPSFALFPAMNYLARGSIECGGGLGLEVWIVVGLQVFMRVLSAQCYSTVSIFIAAAAPNKASLGATSGLAQLSVSIVRTVGPTLASLVYSLSIDEDHHYMNGELAYFVTVALSLGGVWMGSLLPKHPWKNAN